MRNKKYKAGIPDEDGLVKLFFGSDSDSDSDSESEYAPTYKDELKNSILGVSSTQLCSINFISGDHPLYSARPFNNTCGLFWPEETFALFSALRDLLKDQTLGQQAPNTIISVGSGRALLEHFFNESGFNVTCYDIEVPNNPFTPVKQATLPDDIDVVLPPDCSDVILFSGYPKECYLASTVAEFIKRGGKFIITTVNISISDYAHCNFDTAAEEANLLLRSLNKLISDDGDSFTLVPGNYFTSKSYQPTRVEFYNFPPGTKEFIQTKIRTLSADMAESLRDINNEYATEEDDKPEESDTNSNIGYAP